MSIAILHLSDIHFSEKQNPILDHPRSVSSTLFSYLPQVSAAMIVITGDIAQSGKTNEYEHAKNFIKKLIENIKNEKDLPVYVILAPGNHDCDFEGDQEARIAVIGNVANKAGAIPPSYIEAGVAVQKNFFKFRAELEDPSIIVYSDQLWTSYAIEVDGKKIFFDTLNASWMSTRTEQQGGLLFPYERYGEFKPTDCDLRISILHHPLNWYSQRNYLAFRSFLHRLSDIILSGHEHQSHARTTDDEHDGACAFIEGGALQSRQSLKSSFNILLINLEERRFQYKRYSLDNKVYSSEDSIKWTDYRALPLREASEWSLTESFSKILNDPGATLKHPSGHQLQLTDIYVYPDLDVRSHKHSDDHRKANKQKINSRFLIKAESIKDTVLLEGEESAGKTRLLYRLYSEYHSQGFLPLLLLGEHIKNSSPNDLDRLLNQGIAQQYGKGEMEKYWQFSRSRRLLLIDDFDRSPLNPEGKSKALRFLREHFNGTVVTVGENYELAEIIAGEELSSASNGRQYKIAPFGHQRRVEIIKKWNSIGSDETISQDSFLVTCDEAETLIESTRLQYVASTVPIFILSLLQAMHSGAAKSIQNSSFSHYYHFLVVGGLENAGVSANEINQYIAACTHLSWYIKQNGDNQKITKQQFKSHVQAYSDEWTETDPDELLEVLLKSRLLEFDGDAIYFTYPYSYYYFLGRYTNIQIEREDVKGYLDFCMSNLNVRECANTLVFLAHHSGNSIVLDHIVSALTKLFDETPVATLEKCDIRKLSGLLACSPKLKYNSVKPNQYRLDRAKIKDEHDDGDDGLLDSPRDKRNENQIFRDLICLLKGIEIAGALLTHQFSNYPKTKKKTAITAIFDSALRAIRVMYSHFEEDPDELVKAISLRVRANQKDLTSEQAEVETRLAIGFLLIIIATSFIKQAGAHLNSKVLAGQIDEIINENPTNAYKLIKLAQVLQTPHRLPRLEIERLIKTQKDNPCVIGVLQLFVLERMYLFDTTYDDKDWALSIFQLGKHSNTIEQKHNKYLPNFQGR